MPFPQGSTNIGISYIKNSFGVFLQDFSCKVHDENSYKL